MDTIKKFFKDNKTIVLVIGSLAAVGSFAIYYFTKEQKILVIDPSVQNVPLLERLGGEETMDQMLNLYTDKVISHEELKQFFDDSNSKKKFRNGFKSTSLQLMNGKVDDLSGLKQIHLKMNITNAQYDLALSILIKGFKDTGVQNKEIEDTKQQFEKLRSVIVSG